MLVEPLAPSVALPQRAGALLPTERTCSKALAVPDSVRPSRPP